MQSTDKQMTICIFLAFKAFFRGKVKYINPEVICKKRLLAQAL